MVSSPKIQCQEQKQRSRDSHLRSKDDRSQIRIQKGPKPLEKKSFYLDIKNHALSLKLESKIKELGGEIEHFLVRSVTVVISDRVDKTGPSSSEKRKWESISGESGGPPSLRSIELPTPPTPYIGTEGPLSNSTNIRGQTTQRSKSRVDAMLERALTQPQQCSVDPLNNAHSWGIPIWAVEKLQTWLEKICASLKNTKNLQCKNNSAQTIKKPKVKHLKEPFIKFESYHRNTRPVFLELPSWPKINFEGKPGTCPFDNTRCEKSKTNANIKDIKENRENAKLVNKEKEKEMTRRPRATATRSRKTEQLVSGYCEICNIDYRDLSRHIQSDQHLSFVQNNDNFLSLDKLISTGASVEAFLKLNQPKDVNEDCKLFPSDERNELLSVNKLKKNSKSDLNAFNVEDNMVQCNGVRRSLNLSLSSPHNLRTRAKHESGHLLRSKGKSWHDVDTNDKLYDKYEGFTIKKRAKGTIWIEEDSDENSAHEDNACNEAECERKILLGNFVKSDADNENELKVAVNNVNCNNQFDVVNSKICESSKQLLNDGLVNKTKVNGYNDKNHCKQTDSCGSSKEDCSLNKGCDEQIEEEKDKITLCNGTGEKQSPKEFKSVKKMMERGRNCRGRRGGRNLNKGRQRLSVEERLIEDNRAYYKVEVLGNKLRSSTVPNVPVQTSAPKEIDEKPKKEENQSSEKPVVVRFKRVRKSELSLLSDEAESFMFGELRREDSSEASEDEQSSILPKETESEHDEACNSFNLSSSEISNDPSKQEVVEEDSQDSISLGRSRKKRRTQAEALIMDNVDYYKFETPGSRLRYQAPFSGIKDNAQMPENAENINEMSIQENVLEKCYPSKPSAEIEKLHFSFETVPKSEPWYQTYQRQDEGAEFWHYFSEADASKPFLLPYEIENFHETLLKKISKAEGHGKRGRSRGATLVGRSPRKSPRCHASTLAIMSTIIRKREQQQAPNLTVIEEESQNSVQTKADSEYRSDIDEELKVIAKNIDEMLCAQDMQDLEDYIELDMIQNSDSSIVEPRIPKGPPTNLLELLENCHAMVPNIEYSSCASSECGEILLESPLKRRKKRKNKTGWPGSRLRRKLHPKHLVCDVVSDNAKKITEQSKKTEEIATSMVAEHNATRTVETNLTDATICDQQETLQNKGKQDLGVKLKCKITDKESSSVELENVVEENLPLLEMPVTDQSINNIAEEKKEHVSKNEEKRTLWSPDNDANLELSTTRVNVKNEHTTDTEDETSQSKEKEDDEALSDRIIKTEIEETVEDALMNDENHENVCRKDTNNILSFGRQQKIARRKRPRPNTSSEDTHDTHTEVEHEFGNLISKNYEGTTNLPGKRQKSSEPQKIHVAYNETSCKRNGANSRKKRRSRKRQKKCTSSSEVDLEVENNCKKETYCPINSLVNVNSTPRKGSRKSKDNERIMDNPQDSDLKERITSPILTSSEIDHKRSNIDFQPVVRVMKIDEHVDIDHSILSVTVASNRRLRSSDSPKSNVRTPTKRFKGVRGQFRRWIKNS